MSKDKRLMQYELMHKDIAGEYQSVCEKMEELKAQGLTKKVTFKTLMARKLTLREWLDTYKKYGIDEESLRVKNLS